MGCLNYVMKTAKLGLIHESIDVNSGYAYTSEFFPWKPCTPVGQKLTYCVLNFRELVCL